MSDACRIRVLEEHVVGQIAAGEVVERPASVVKELVENALDAQASRVDVAVAAGGCSEIRVVDDGHGMSVDEAQLCLWRHATSKLRRPEELSTVRTLGFRGEGLSSVAAVSRISLMTLARGQLEGTALEAEGGRLVSVGPTGCPMGTRVTVRDLFYNTPARAKFLKSTATEAAHVTDTVNRLALGFESVRFTLRHGERLAIDLAPRSERRLRAVDVLGQSLEVAEGQGGDWLQVRAYLAPLAHTASTARSLIFVVNQRAVRDRMLLQAVLSALDERLAAGRYPVGVVYLDLFSEGLDVNVHPQKTEVRFAQPRAVHRAVRDTLATLATQSVGLRPARRYELRGSGSESSVGLAADMRLEQAKRRFWGEPEAQTPGSDRDYGLAAALERRDWAAQRTVPGAVARDASPTARPTLVARLFERVLLCEWGESLVFVDPERAWQRVVSAELRAALAEGPLEPIELRRPLQIPSEASTSARQRSTVTALATLGFTVEPFGRESWLLRSVPRLIADEQSRQEDRDDEPSTGVRLTRSVGAIEQLVGEILSSEGGAAEPRDAPFQERWAEQIDRISRYVAQERAGRADTQELMRALEQLRDPAALDAATLVPAVSGKRPAGALVLTRTDMLRSLTGGE